MAIVKDVKYESAKCRSATLPLATTAKPGRVETAKTKARAPE